MILKDLINVMAPEQQFKVIDRHGYCGGAIYQKAYFDKKLSQNWNDKLLSQVSTIHTTTDELIDVIYIWLK